MELEPITPLPPTLPPSKIKLVFYNDRGLRAGWRLLIFIAILAALLAAARVGMILLRGRTRNMNSASSSPWALGLGEFVTFLFVVVAAWIMSKIERRKAGVYGLPLMRSAMPKFVIGYLAWGFLPLAVVLLVMRALGVFYFGNAGIRGLDALYWAVAWGLVFLAVGLLEEFLFRGYLLYTLADGIGFWPAAVILAVLFGAAHRGNGGESYIGIVGASLFAIFAAATLRRTGNLWLAVGAHAGWDWGQSYFFGVADSGLQMPGHLLNPHTQGPAWLSGGTVGPEGSIVVVILWTLLLVAFLLLYKSRPKAGGVMASVEQGQAHLTAD